MRTRTLVAGVAAVLVLLAAGVLLWRERGGPPPAPAPAEAREDSPAAPSAARGAPAGLTGGGAAAPGAAAPLARPAPEDVDPSWRESRVVFRLRELGPAAVWVQAGLRSAREEMAHCFEAASRSAAGEPDVAASPAVLVLYLEEREGAVDVVEVRVDRPGTSPGELVECCASVLRGHEMRVPAAVPGRRYRFPMPLE